MGLGPVAPQIGQEPDQDHGVLCAGGTRPRTEGGGHQRVRGPFENEQRQVAIAPVVMVIEREFLLAMRRVIGVIEVEPNGGGRLRVAGDEVIDQGLREPVEVLAVDAVFQRRKGGSTRQVLLWLQGRPLNAQLKHGVVPETIGIIAVGIPGGDLIDTLGQEVTEGVVDIGWMPLVLHGSRKAFGEANLAVDAPQQEGAKVGGQGPACEIGPHGRASDRRKTQLFWSRIQHKQTSCGFYGIALSHTLFYQRLARGLCFFMKNSG